MNSIAEWKDIKKRLGDATKRINQLAKKELKSIKDADAFEKLLQGLSLETLKNELEDWRRESLDFIRSEWELLRKNFRKSESQFIREKKDEGVPIKELDRAWRVGPLKLLFNDQKCTVKIVYNEQAVVNQKVVADSEDIRKLYDEAQKQLKKVELPFEKLAEIFWQAYEKGCLLACKKNTEDLPIKDFYQEVRVELFRTNMIPRKIKSFPEWAFLYNLDVYVSNCSKIPEEKRLLLKSGGQLEIQRNMGMVVNGLDPLKEYKTVCYVGRYVR
jgi:hypothetical protein